MRIALVIWHIDWGGAERVLAILASAWAARGWEVHVMTLEPAPSPVRYDLHPGIVLHPVGFDPPASSGGWRRPRIPVTMRLRSAIRELHPDAIISFMNTINIRVLLATAGLRAPVFVCEHCDPWARSIGAVNELLRRRLYPSASSVVVLTPEALSYFPPKTRARATVIPNPVMPAPPGFFAATAPDTESTRRVVSVGRLVAVKRFDRLISAFGAVAHALPHWKLEIWGEGPERERLQSLIGQLGLAARVELCGPTDNTYRELAKAHLFAMTSETEGFPMALCEAMACGLPVVAMDCPSGPRNIIRAGIDGVLTPDADVPAFAEAMNRLMSDPAERIRLASRAPEVSDRFGVECVLNKWDELFARTTLPH